MYLIPVNTFEQNYSNLMVKKYFLGKDIRDNYDGIENHSYLEFEYNNNFKIEYLFQDEPVEILRLRQIFEIDDIINSLLEQVKDNLNSN